MFGQTAKQNRVIFALSGLVLVCLVGVGQVAIPNEKAAEITRIRQSINEPQGQRSETTRKFVGCFWTSDWMEEPVDADSCAPETTANVTERWSL